MAYSVLLAEVLDVWHYLAQITSRDAWEQMVLDLELEDGTALVSPLAIDAVFDTSASLAETYCTTVVLLVDHDGELVVVPRTLQGLFA